MTAAVRAHAIACAMAIAIAAQIPVAPTVVETAQAELSDEDLQVSAGQDFTCGSWRTSAFCWGRNYGNNLGSDLQGLDWRFPEYVQRSSGGFLAAGGRHACAWKWGELSCWGENESGQLGNGTTQSRWYATPIPNADYRLFATGMAHTCAELSVPGGSALHCWGRNDAGQLGDGTIINRPSPVAVVGPLDVNTLNGVAAGSAHTCAVVNGGAKCWGANDSGQLGDGTTTQRSTPVNVEGLTTGVHAIVAGAAHTCAVMTSGALKCWGSNVYGQLGDGTTVSKSTPVDVAGLGAGVTKASGGGGHTCAITSTGVRCWGRNDFGQLGDGTQIQRLAPTNVVDLVDATAISAGTTHSCAVAKWGIHCWGSNLHGQIGDGTRVVPRLTPVLVFPFQSRGFAIGLSPYPGVGGQIETRLGLDNGLSLDGRIELPWRGYYEAGGGTRPAFGDVDGDGWDELVVGLTNTGITDGWVAVLDDFRYRYRVLKWLRVRWPEYNAANGETFPALGDIDNDGRDEIVIGLGPGGGGWYEIFDDAATDFAHLTWRRVNWWKYQGDDADGRTHPAVGDFNADGEAEIALGLGPGSNGWLEIVTGASAGFSHSAWIQVPWTAYNAANGTTYPAAWRDDWLAKLVIGLGQGGGCWYQVRNDATMNYGHVRWGRINWPEYCAANGELHPAVGSLDYVPGKSLLFGLGPYAGDGGWVFMEMQYGDRTVRWVNVDWPEFRSAGGGTFPAIGRRR